MRLDKFLKVSRIIKRRPIAKKVSDNGNVKVNGKVAKASTKVSIGDELEVEYFNKTIKAKIKDIPTGNIKKSEAKKLIDII
ncbi:MAG: RNA-binding S4 domain-containing protein [Fusobacteriota bacterium]